MRGYFVIYEPTRSLPNFRQFDREFKNSMFLCVLTVTGRMSLSIKLIVFLLVAVEQKKRGLISCRLKWFFNQFTANKKLLCSYSFLNRWREILLFPERWRLRSVCPSTTCSSMLLPLFRSAIDSVPLFFTGALADIPNSNYLVVNV